MAKNVRVVDRGWKKAMRDMEELGRSRVKVGIAAGQAGATTAVIDYAVMNEFGTEDIPARPFMRHTADEAEGAIQTYARRLVRSLLSGSVTVDGVLGRLGQWYEYRLRGTIRNSPSWAKANAPATIAMKGSSKPLVDHGVMSGAIQYEKERK